MVVFYACVTHFGDNPAETPQLGSHDSPSWGPSRLFIENTYGTKSCTKLPYWTNTRMVVQNNVVVSPIRPLAMVFGHGSILSHVDLGGLCMGR